jgi:hypothetical protein
MKLVDLIGQQLDVTAGGEGENSETPGVLTNYVEGVGTDRTC